MKEDSKFKKMTEEPVETLICKLAVPTIISMMITAIYNMADSFFVSKINTSTTGAVGVVFSYMAIIQALGFLFGQGSGNYVSRALGNKRYEDAQVMVVSGFVIAFVTGVIIAVCGLFFGGEMVDLLGATPTIKPYAKTYLIIVSIGAPFMCSSLVLNNQLRFQGSATYAMVGISVGGILNAILDPILIFKFNMGIAGAATATAFSQFVSFILLVIGTNMGENIRLKFSKLS
ncbi:MAG: MATE family efflux transporter, partial [Lachnospirales bacterium]